MRLGGADTVVLCRALHPILVDLTTHLCARGAVPQLCLWYQMLLRAPTVSALSTIARPRLQSFARIAAGQVTGKPQLFR